GDRGGGHLGGEPAETAGEQVAERAGGEAPGGGVPARRVHGEGAPARHPGGELAKPDEGGGPVAADGEQVGVGAARRPGAERLHRGVVLQVEEQREPAAEVLDRLVEGDQARRLAAGLVEVDGGELAAGGEEQVVAEDERAVAAAGDVDLEP